MSNGCSFSAATVGQLPRRVDAAASAEGPRGRGGQRLLSTAAPKKQRPGIKVSGPRPATHRMDASRRATGVGRRTTAAADPSTEHVPDSGRSQEMGVAEAGRLSNRSAGNEQLLLRRSAGRVAYNFECALARPAAIARQGRPPAGRKVTHSENPDVTTSAHPGGGTDRRRARRRPAHDRHWPVRLPR